MKMLSTQIFSFSFDDTIDKENIALELYQAQSLTQGSLLTMPLGEMIVKGKSCPCIPHSREITAAAAKLSDPFRPPSNNGLGFDACTRSQHRPSFKERSDGYARESCVLRMKCAWVRVRGARQSKGRPTRAPDS